MSFRPDEITKEHVLKAVQLIDDQKIILIPSTKYVVEINGKQYPPKEIMRYAHEQMNGEHIWNYGGGNMTNKYLEKMGFTIVPLGTNVITELLTKYKNHIRNSGLEGELYKWELIKKFNGRPNLTNQNLYEELTSIDFSNLLYYNAHRVMRHLANERGDQYKDCLQLLFDESISLQSRIKEFTNKINQVYREIEHTLYHQHDERTIAILLTYRNPKKYTFFKSSYYSKYCKLLGTSPKAKGEKYVHYLELVEDLVNDYLLEDEELISLISPLINFSSDINEFNYKLLAQDILYQTLDKQIGIGRNYWRIGTKDGPTSYWYSMKNNKRICIGWPDLGDLNEIDINSKKDIEEALVEAGYYIDNNQLLSRKAGEVFNFCSNIKIGDIVLVQDGSNVLGIGEILNGEYLFDSESGFPHQKEVEWKSIEPGITNSEGLQTTVYKLSNLKLINQIEELLKSKELSSKITNKMESNIPLNQILYGPPGTGKTYKIQNEYCQLFTDKQHKQTAEEKLRDDIKSFPWWKVVAAVLYKQSQPIDVKTIASDILVEAKYRKVKTPATNIIWNELLTSGDDDSSKLAIKYRAKTQLFKKDDNSRWSLIDKTIIETVFPDIVELSKYNHSVPVTTVDNKRYKFVTFHQKYGYEDFIEGIRPVLSKEANDENSTEKSALSFELRKGIFYQCCLKALELAGFDSFEDCHNCSKDERKQRFEAIKNIKEKQYAIFIDEINRANISAVFGELITLIEEDKRIGADNELWLELPGSNSCFAVPSNLFIIGTMNTADKSIALVDIALRRRFEFLKMYPDYGLIPEWSDLLKKLNESIYSIKKNADFFIGHSFFINKPTTELSNIFNRKIIPLLLEYFQNNTESVKKVLSAANIMVTEDDNHQIIA